MNLSSSPLERYRDAALLCTRIGLGLFFMLVHGLPKLLGGPELWERLGSNISILGISGGYLYFGFLAAILEFLGGLFLITGFFFSYTALGMSLIMIVAMLSKFTTDGWFGAAHPSEVFLFLITLAFVGPGKFSLDFLIKKALHKKSA
jgi:putative oxidoreductase